MFLHAKRSERRSHTIGIIIKRIRKDRNLDANRWLAFPFLFSFVLPPDSMWRGKDKVIKRKEALAPLFMGLNVFKFLSLFLCVRPNEWAQSAWNVMPHTHPNKYKERCVCETAWRFSSFSFIYCPAQTLSLKTKSFGPGQWMIKEKEDEFIFSRSDFSHINSVMMWEKWK